MICCIETPASIDGKDYFDMATLKFIVPGNPVPQPRPRVTARGKCAHAYTPKTHPITAYREAVRLAAIKSGAECTDELIVVYIHARFQRPKSHWNKNDIKKTAPQTPRADGDNIAKGVMDALTGVAWHDDKQAVCHSACKSFAAKTAAAETIIYIAPRSDPVLALMKLFAATLEGI